MLQHKRNSEIRNRKKQLCYQLKAAVLTDSLLSDLTYNALIYEDDDDAWSLYTDSNVQKVNPCSMYLTQRSVLLYQMVKSFDRSTITKILQIPKPKKEKIAFRQSNHHVNDDVIESSRLSRGVSLQSMSKKKICKPGEHLISL